MKLNKYYNILKNKRIANIVISLTLVASILIILFTIYGNQVGNFVVTIEERNRLSLSLSENESFENSFTRITAEGVQKLQETTYGFIPKNIDSVDGSHNDIENTYFAYTFYLKNTSSVAVNYNIKLNIDKVSKNVDSAVRIMVIRNIEEPLIYAKWREFPEPKEVWGQPEEHLNDYDYFGQKVIEKYSTTSFLSEATAFSKQREAFPPKTIDKYTVVMWIEGMDAQCSDNEVINIKGGTLKLSLEFSIG